MFWLIYTVITLCLLYIMYKVDRHYYWCQHNFKAIKDAMKNLLLLNNLTHSMINGVDEKVNEVIKKGGKNVKKK